MRPLCIYHGNCADGFSAAWVVWKSKKGDVDIVADIYGNTPPDVAGRDVILVDFSYKRDVLVEMATKANSILVIDHHESAQQDLMHIEAYLAGMEQAGAPHTCGVQTYFDMEHSGAMLAWMHYFPGKAPPQLLRHVEDRDIWKFALPGTREIQAALFSYPYELAVWDALMESDCAELRRDGMAIERKHFKDITELTQVVTRQFVIAGHAVPVANLPYTLTSDAGHLLAQGKPFAGCYWDTPEGRVFSLRSTEDGLNVAQIAMQYGGGGHKHAAGFRVPYDHPLVTHNNG